MKEFNLDEALAGKPVITRNGLKVLELHLFNAGNAKYKLGAVIEGYDEIRAFTLNGRHIEDVPHHLDLFMAEETYYGFENKNDYYSLDNDGDVSIIKYSSINSYHKKRIEQGNLFKTKEEAEKERNYRAAKFRLNAKMRELEGALEAYWDDEEQQKFFFCFDNRRAYCSLEISYNCSRKYAEDWRYSNEETIKWVIENMADDIKTVLGV